ncbi:hypothetical protein J6590_054799 [Homalodisca vitripennis]|nr:hypothetical protein J6590_054799 [Homalodisca vitripennis]
MIESEATVMNELETVIQVPRVSEIGAVGYKYSKFFRRLTRGFGADILWPKSNKIVTSEATTSRIKTPSTTRVKCLSSILLL